MIRRVLVLLLLTIITGPYLSAQGTDREADRLYRAVIDGDFLSDKLAAGEKLGRRNTPAARDYLMKLIADKDYWNRSAGIMGLVWFDDPEAAETIIKLWLNDSMTADVSAEAMGKRASRFQPLLEERYKRSGEEERKAILALFGSWGNPATDRFLEGRIGDRAERLRSEALEAYLVSRPGSKRSVVLPLLSDPLLRPRAAEWAADYGTTEELPQFRTMIKNREKGLYGAAARGINRLGSLQECEAVMFELLASGENEALWAALTYFDRPVSDRLMKQLCPLVFDGEYQEIRMLAAVRLTAYRDKRIIPALIRARREAFIPSRADGWDIFAAHITLGLSALFRHLEEKQREKQFNGRQGDINNHLRSLTGEKLNAPADWTEWAITQGFTIDNQSLITRLFSPLAAVRDKAADDAIRLMGFSTRDFYRKNPELLELPPERLSLELAQRLTEARLILPERP